MVYCSSCGMQLEEKKNFCTGCGQPNLMAPPAKVSTIANCNKCGMALEENNNFCTFCGEPKNIDDSNQTIEKQIQKKNVNSFPQRANYNSVTEAPIWVQSDLQQQLIGNETVKHSVIFANYPFGLKKSYVAVTEKRLVGRLKTWLKTKQIDIPLHDISRVQLDTSLNFKAIIWLIISIFFSFYIIGIPFAIYNYYRINEKKLLISISGVGDEYFEGRRHKLELIQRTIREMQFQK